MAEASSKVELFAKVKSANDDEDYNGAMELLQEAIGTAKEISAQQMELVNWVIDNKITSSEFGDDQKASCHLGLELLNQLDLVKDGDWLQNYESAVYSIFNRLNRTVRDGERDTTWTQLKEKYYGIIGMARKIWKEKNQPERLEIVAHFAKMCKCYADVVDNETIAECETMAKEAKFMGRGALDDEQFRDSSAFINEIRLHIADCIREKERFHEDDDDEAIGDDDDGGGDYENSAPVSYF